MLSASPKDQARQFALEELTYWIQDTISGAAKTYLTPPFSQPQLRVFTLCTHGMR